jgi:hypothetical protein
MHQPCGGLTIDRSNGCLAKILSESEKVREADSPIPVQIEPRVKPLLAGRFPEVGRKRQEVPEAYGAVAIEVR